MGARSFIDRQPGRWCVETRYWGGVYHNAFPGSRGLFDDERGGELISRAKASCPREIWALVVDRLDGISCQI